MNLKKSEKRPTEKSTRESIILFFITTLHEVESCANKQFTD